MVAPPDLPPRPRHKGVLVTAVLHIILGIACVVLNALLLREKTQMIFAPGLWGGALFLLTGVMGIFASRRARGYVYGYMIFNILSFGCSPAIIVPAILEGLHKEGTLNPTPVTTGLDLGLAAAGIAEFCLSLAGTVICCVVRCVDVRPIKKKKPVSRPKAPSGGSHEVDDFHDLRLQDLPAYNASSYAPSTPMIPLNAAALGPNSSHYVGTPHQEGSIFTFGSRTPYQPRGSIDSTPRPLPRPPETQGNYDQLPDPNAFREKRLASLARCTRDIQMSENKGHGHVKGMRRAHRDSPPAYDIVQSPGLPPPVPNPDYIELIEETERQNTQYT